jgi:hypothetical protein
VLVASISAQPAKKRTAEIEATMITILELDFLTFMVSFNWFDPDNICPQTMTLSCARELCGAAAQSPSAPQYRLSCTGIRLVMQSATQSFSAVHMMP